MISLVLVIRLWRGNEHLVIKCALTFVTVIPFVGPVFYGFYWGTSEIKPQKVFLQNRGSRGEYTDTWISINPILKKFLKENEEPEEDLEQPKDQKNS